MGFRRTRPSLPDADCRRVGVSLIGQYREHQTHQGHDHNFESSPREPMLNRNDTHAMIGKFAPEFIEFRLR